MNLPLVLRAEARADFDEAFDWYEAQQPGLGVDFAARVQEVFDRISANPLLHVAVFQDVRKAIVQRFPYCVFYRLAPRPGRADPSRFPPRPRSPARRSPQGTLGPSCSRFSRDGDTSSRWSRTWLLLPALG